MSILILHDTPQEKTGFLAGLLSQVGISLRDTVQTHVFPTAARDLDVFCGPKSEGIPGMPALVKGKYANASYRPELERVYSTINHVNPNIIIALGAAASWATLGTAGVKSIRGALQAAHPIPGTVFTTHLNRSFKVLPTYSPATVLRDWTLRPIVMADFDKARRQSLSSDITRPNRYIWLEPNLSDLAEYETRYIVHSDLLSIDIETKGDQVTCIGFSPDAHNSIVIPFFAQGWPKNNYWATLEEELEAWKFVRRWCQMKPSLFQNGLYDIKFLWRSYGIKASLAEHDTMLLHHALQPEMQKGLGFMATLYTDEASWKFMSKTETLKKEDD